MSQEALFRRAFETALRRHVPLIAYMASMMRSGVPDEYLLFDGRSYWLELKAIREWPKGLDANVLTHRFTGPQLAFMRRVDAGGGRGLGIVGFGDPWACVAIRVHNLGADGTLTRRQIERHRVLPLDTWFADRFLNLITRS